MAKSWMDSYRDVRDFFAPVQNTEIKYSIWRSIEENKMPVPMFVKREDIKLDDYIFTESEEFEGYAIIKDLVRDEKSKEIVHWQLRPAGFDRDRENKMLKVVENIITEAANNGVSNVLIYIGVRENVNL